MEEIKVPEVPVTEVLTTPETKPTEPAILSRREEVEAQVAVEMEFTPDKAPEAEVKAPDVKTEEEPIDQVERIKKATQKRIDKLTAKSKSAEEELVEARAEIERLKTNPKTPEVIVSNDKAVTPEQVEAYIAKMQEEGNHKEAAAAIRFLVKMEKETAIKEVQEVQKKAQTQTATETARQNADMKALANDYVVLDESGKPDIKADMTLANQNGVLFKLAMDYFNDKNRHAERYNDPNVVNGFRRATADAYRDIAEHNRLNRLTPKAEMIEPKKVRKEALADPDASANDETPASVTHSNPLSDAETAREEINNRKKNLQKRRTP